MRNCKKDKDKRKLRINKIKLKKKIKRMSLSENKKKKEKKKSLLSLFLQIRNLKLNNLASLLFYSINIIQIIRIINENERSAYTQ